jgi:hypothetical protein
MLLVIEEKKEAAERYGVSDRTICNWLKMLGFASVMLIVEDL